MSAKFHVEQGAYSPGTPRYYVNAVGTTLDWMPNCAHAQETPRGMTKAPSGGKMQSDLALQSR